MAFPGSNYRWVEKMMMDPVREAVFGNGDLIATLKTAQEQAQDLMP